jgi:TRAP-type C4-dicarboxylate transport system permease small subunit
MVYQPPPADDGVVPQRRVSPFGMLTTALAVAGSIWIFAIMVLINVDVFGRYLFGAPVTGVPEIVSLSIVGIVFLQLSNTLRVRRFIRSDVIIGRLLELRPRLGHILQAIHHLAGLLVIGTMVYFVWPNLAEAWIDKIYIGDIGHFTMVTWPILAIIVVAGSITCLQFALHLITDIRIALGAEHEDIGK